MSRDQLYLSFDKSQNKPQKKKDKKGIIYLKTAYKPIILFQEVVLSCVEAMETTKTENVNVILDGKAKNVV